MVPWGRLKGCNVEHLLGALVSGFSRAADGVRQGICHLTPVPTVPHSRPLGWWVSANDLDEAPRAPQLVWGSRGRFRCWQTHRQQQLSFLPAIRCIGRVDVNRSLICFAVSPKHRKTASAAGHAASCVRYLGRATLTSYGPSYRDQFRRPTCPSASCVQIDRNSFCCRPLPMTKALLCTIALSAIAGCGSDSVEEAWRSAGARPGWYVGDASGFSVADEKPRADSIPGFWAHTEFDFDRLGSLPIPPKPFALHFGGSQLSDSHFEQLKRFYGAEYLGLNRTRISDAGLSHILAFPDIKSLDLGYADVGDEGIESLSRAGNLSSLILSSTKVSDAGAVTLSGIETLEVLDISDTSITDAGLQKLASLPRLRYLGVSNTRATAEGITAVKQQHPDLEVVE